MTLIHFQYCFIFQFTINKYFLNSVIIPNKQIIIHKLPWNANYNNTLQLTLNSASGSCNAEIFTFWAFEVAPIPLVISVMCHYISVYVNLVITRKNVMHVSGLFCRKQNFLILWGCTLVGNLFMIDIYYFSVNCWISTNTNVRVQLNICVSIRCPEIMTSLSTHSVQ